MKEETKSRSTVFVAFQRNVRGFTLLELLIVVAILVAIAGLATIALRDVEQEKAVDVTRAEMQEIGKAIRQFRADTGYFPGEGPFGLLDADSNGEPDVNCDFCTTSFCSSEGAVSLEELLPVPPPPITALDIINAEREFESSTNFSQLFSQPEICENHPLARVLAAGRFVNTGRGWNGPYIVSSEGVVNLGSSPDRSTGLGSLTPGSAISGITSLADPFLRSSNAFSWRSSVGGDPANSLGSPYMLFVTTIDNRDVARLVSIGLDGEYAGVIGDDSMDEWCSPQPGSDDIVLCF